MSDDTLLPADDGPDPDVAAAELALGLLEGEERALALRRVLAEPGFAHSVEVWRTYLSRLFDLWPEMTPSGGVLARIERSIDAPAVPVEMPAQRRSLLWPGIAAVASLLAASLLLVVLLRPISVPTAPPQPKPTMAPAPAQILVAAIDPATTGAPVTAVYDPASGGLRLTEAALADANQSAELWIIGADATPHSLGLLRTKGGTVLTVNAANRAQIAAGATLAISLEAVGGSPTGQPQGPVVAKGTLSQV
ncbi:anti-sigma factor [Sphingomonas sp. Leaf357]|uniref:anti-sigma factor n=1 Tax=Sphingomonas sp. Leaf357 TaxID=1736350 RepID=UPI0006F83EC5|nr:anti-sigma factor [Sphingomonas sp. Leaf357]KQS03424.1 anti-sigma factor [Sphingomonas sp. Leaf357]